MCVLCYFFFFKQKTAYEIRISDWSSDVCSSDLSSRRAVRSRSATACSAISDGPNAGATVLRCAPCSGSSIAMNIASFTLVSCISKRTIPPCSNDEENVCGRSEEHTSELQSLMRISYAVFCLKKKKPQTTTQSYGHMYQ